MPLGLEVLHQMGLRKRMRSVPGDAFECWEIYLDGRHPGRTRAGGLSRPDAPVPRAARPALGEEAAVAHGPDAEDCPVDRQKRVGRSALAETAASPPVRHHRGTSAGCDRDQAPTTGGSARSALAPDHPRSARCIAGRPACRSSACRSPHLADRLRRRRLPWPCRRRPVADRRRCHPP